MLQFTLQEYNIILQNLSVTIVAVEIHLLHCTYLAWFKISESLLASVICSVIQKERMK